MVDHTLDQGVYIRSMASRGWAGGLSGAVADVIQRAGYEPDGRSAAQTAEFFRQEVAAAGETVRAAGIQPN